MKKLVSIITPVYNAEKYLEITINSVLEQTYTDWELILIDDCSSDDSKKIILNYAKKDKRIKSVFLNTNGGVASARNEGINVANGHYIAFLDSDDLWHKEKLAKQIDFMEENDYSFTYTNYSMIDNLGNDLKKEIKPVESLSYKDLLKGNQIGCLCVIIQREILNELKFLRIGHEDYVMWLNILKLNNISAYCLPENLAYYRKLDNSLSSNKLKAAKWTWNIYRKNQKLSFLKSAYYFINYCNKSLKKHYY